VELTNEKDDAGPIKCLLLCTKANDAIEAVSGVWDRLSTKGSRSCDDGDGSTSTLSSSTHDATGKVIVLSNGALAIRDAMYDRFGRRSHDDIDNEYCGMGPGGMERSLTLGGVRIILGTTTHGAYRTRSTRSTVGTMYDDDDDADFVTHYDIVHAGIGTTTCADREFVDACTSIGWDARYVSLHAEMDAILWRKLAANCVINPLTAIHGMRNGDLLDVMMGRSRGGRIDDDADSIRTIAFGILKEVSAVATREMAYHTSTANILSVPLLEDYVLGVMSATRDNVSSMLQDVEAGRTTEVRYLNGYVSRLGRERHGIECSLNFEMCRLVEEMNYSSRRVNLHT
jgi:ketopantoate reductase